VSAISLTAFTPIVSPAVGTVLGWFASAIILTALCNRFLPWPQGCRDNSLIFCGLILLMLLPVGDHPGLAAGLHGMLGTPSGTLWQLSVLTCLNRPWPPFPARRVLWLIIILMAGYFALSLGVGSMVIDGMPDPYGLGFSPDVLWIALVVGAYLLYRYQQTGWLIILTINILLWRTGLLPSRNLLDVMFDPMLLAVLVWHGVQRRA
jgi:hypothetical protein